MISKLPTQLPSTVYSTLFRSCSSVIASGSIPCQRSYPLLSRHYASGPSQSSYSGSRSDSLSNSDDLSYKQKDAFSTPSVSLNSPVTNKAHFSQPPPLIEDQIESHIDKKSRVSQSATSKSSPAMKRLSPNELSTYLERNISSYQNIKSFSDLPLEFGHNQHMAIDEELRENLRSVIWKFNAPIKYAFAYGSGVFSQGKPFTSQVDLIFGVSYTQHWHSLNMRQNPHHYSMLRQLGSSAVSFVQDKMGAGVFFSPTVEIDGLKIKYGVVNIDTLLGDLTNWNTLYLAGRLHKPVKILRDEPRIRFTNQTNLISALRTSLLLLPEEFTELDLYSTLASLSDISDSKMSFDKSSEKVKNIVNNQFINFRNLYSPLLDMLQNVHLQSLSNISLPSNPEIGVASMKQNMDPKVRSNMIARLPHEFKEKLYRRYQSKYQRDDSGSLATVDPTAAEAIQEATKLGKDVLSGTTTSFDQLRKGTKFDQLIAADQDLALNVSKAIKSATTWASFTQSCKGIFSASSSWTTPTWLNGSMHLLKSIYNFCIFIYLF